MRLHPSFGEKLHLLAGITSVQEAMADPEQAANLAEFMNAGTPDEAPPVDDRYAIAPGPHGDVRLRVYTAPAGARTTTALLWVHGGGFVAGSVDDPATDLLARQLCYRSGAVVVSVDYRLAVDGVHYPVPHDDVVAALLWVRRSAADLDISADAICVGGDSGGATLAVGAALRVRDEHGWVPASQILAYPFMHPALPPPSNGLAEALAELPPVLRFSADAIAGITGNYLGSEGRADGYAMPGLANLEGLRETLVVTGESDEVRSSGEQFAADLIKAGVDVRYVMEPGLLHGFLTFPDAVAPVAHCRMLMVETLNSVSNLQAGAATTSTPATSDG